MNAILYPGCLIARRFPNFELASRQVATQLDITFSRGDGFTCCPDPVGIRSLDQDAWLLIAARNLAVAEEILGKERGEVPLVTLCNGCFETLKSANILLKKDSLKEKTNARLGKLGKKFQGNLEVYHFLQIAYNHREKLKFLIKKPLSNLRVALHPGCHLYRPSTLLEFDNPHDPVILEEMVKVLGAEIFSYPSKMLCCGLPLFNLDREISLSLAQKKLSDLRGADALVVTCPSCFLQFETAQMSLKDVPDTSLIPVFYYFELLALALGTPLDELHLDEFRRIKVKEVLKKIG